MNTNDLETIQSLLSTSMQLFHDALAKKNHAAMGQCKQIQRALLQLYHDWGDVLEAMKENDNV